MIEGGLIWCHSVPAFRLASKLEILFGKSVLLRVEIQNDKLIMQFVFESLVYAN